MLVLADTGALHLRRDLGAQRRKVGVQVGRLPADAVAGRRDPLVRAANRLT